MKILKESAPRCGTEKRPIRGFLLVPTLRVGTPVVTALRSHAAQTASWNGTKIKHVELPNGAYRAVAPQERCKLHSHAARGNEGAKQ
jgi:hypothetical protein